MPTRPGKCGNNQKVTGRFRSWDAEEMTGDRVAGKVVRVAGVGGWTV